MSEEHGKYEPRDWRTGNQNAAKPESERKPATIAFRTTEELKAHWYALAKEQGIGIGQLFEQHMPKLE